MKDKFVIFCLSAILMVTLSACSEDTSDWYAEPSRLLTADEIGGVEEVAVSEADFAAATPCGPDPLGLPKDITDRDRHVRFDDPESDLSIVISTQRHSLNVVEVFLKDLPTNISSGCKTPTDSLRGTWEVHPLEGFSHGGIGFHSTWQEPDSNGSTKTHSKIRVYGGIETEYSFGKILFFVMISLDAEPTPDNISLLHNLWDKQMAKLSVR